MFLSISNEKHGLRLMCRMSVSIDCALTTHLVVFQCALTTKHMSLQDSWFITIDAFIRDHHPLPKSVAGNDAKKREWILKVAKAKIINHNGLEGVSVRKHKAGI